MSKHFVYRKNSTNLYWSVSKEWTKFDWATVYSDEEVDAFVQFGYPEDGCEWVPHEPPKPTPVIIGDNSRCNNPGKYWMRFMYPEGGWSVSIQDLNEESTFWEGVSYVYISEPNWPA